MLTKEEKLLIEKYFDIAGYIIDKNIVVIHEWTDDDGDFWYEENINDILEEAKEYELEGE